MAKLNISNTLSATLAALLAPAIAGASTLWEGTRDAYVAARADFSPEDANKAIRQVVTDTLKGNPKSVASYLQTCVWLEKNAAQTPETIAALNMAGATDLRYPKAPKPGQPGYVEHAAKVDKAARDKAEAKEREEAEAATPRSRLLSAIASELADCDETELALIAAEVVEMKASLRATPAADESSEEEEVETPEAANG